MKNAKEFRGTYVRHYVNVLDKKKMMDMSLAEIGAWYLLTLVVARDGEDGILPDADQIEFALRSKEIDVASLIESLVDRGLIDRRKGGDRGVHFQLHEWEYWQADTEAFKEILKRLHARDLSSLVVDVFAPRLASSRAREGQKGGGEDSKNREDRQPELPMPSMAEPPVRPITENDEETESQNSSAPPPPKLATRQGFEKMWEVYWGIPGNPGSSKARAWEVYQSLSEEDQADAGVGVVLWRLELNGKDAGFAKPDPTRKTKIKFLENWLGDEQWKQFNIPDNPQLRSLVG